MKADSSNFTDQRKDFDAWKDMTTNKNQTKNQTKVLFFILAAGKDQQSKKNEVIFITL